MKSTVLSVGRAQLLLGRVIGLAVVIALFFGFVVVLKGDVSSLVGLLPILLISMVPPAATLGLLLAGRRRPAACVALLGTFPPAALFLLLVAQLTNSNGSLVGWLLQGTFALPFLYTAVTLARVAVGVRVTADERRRARQLRAAQHAALTAGPADGSGI